jgi:hypothetical protein
MSRCPCCSEILLRHARRGTTYWFCTHCWQEMPDFSAGINHERHVAVLLSPQPINWVDPLLTDRSSAR